MHAERIDPEAIGTLGVPARDVAGDAFAEAEASEEAKGSGEMDFAVAALFVEGGEGGRRGEVFDSTGCFDHIC